MNKFPPKELTVSYNKLTTIHGIPTQSYIDSSSGGGGSGGGGSEKLQGLALIASGLLVDMSLLRVLVCSSH